MSLIHLPPPPSLLRRRPSRSAVLGAGTALLAGGVATVGSQVIWAAHRRLPSLEGLDASGPIPGRGTEPALRMVALGDSTMTGPGLADPDQIWLRRALIELDLEVPIDLRSLAVGGSRVADVAALLPEVAALAPDVAVVAVGSNDAIHGTSARAFEHQLDELITALLDLGTCVGACNVGDLGNVARVPMPLSSLLRQRSLQISHRVDAVVARHPEVVLLDVTSSNVGFRDRGVFAEDLFHPNESGHALWAAAARPGLARLLAQADDA